MKLTKIPPKIFNKIRKGVQTKHLSLQVSELFFQHNSSKGFLRYDMIVRLLAVENFYGKNDFGFDFYYRMQERRTGKEWADKSVSIFKNLIKSYEENGYDSHSEIEIDSDLHLIDGSHRMALAIYYQCSTISAKIRPYKRNYFYAIEWFKINGFTDEECQVLTDKYRELRKQYMTPFVCTLWHPARAFFDEITQNLSLFGKIVEVQDYQLSEWSYKFYTRGIYAVDDIAKWKIEKKIEHMESSSSSIYRLRMVAMELEEPLFRLKDTNHNTLSTQCELIKKLIRDGFKEKVNNYFHDIIIHIGDNFYQNKHIYKLLTMPPINVKTILSHIYDCQYVLTKFEVPYMPTDFPEHYPLGKDIDIVCPNEEEYRHILRSVWNDVQTLRKEYNLRTVKKTDSNGKEDRTLIRLEQEGEVLAFLFDISCRTGRLKPGFVEEMMKNRIEVGGFYIPAVKYEIIIRLQEIHDAPQKIHHREYIRRHIDMLDKNICDKYLNFNWKKIVNRL